MLTADEIAERRELVATAPDLAALVENLRRRNARVVAEAPPLPAAKALLSVDGGRCEDCGGPLVFDPWSPRVHRCARCAREHGGERHDRAWAKWQHLWLAGRAAETATLAVLTDDDASAARARGILAGYADRYLEYPNEDNVLGPARLFFSTYLESIWLTDYLAAAYLLREGGLLDDDAADGVSRVADEAANLIGEFDEGFSNRQTWHDAALAATAVWFEDEELVKRVLEGETGLVAHLVHGFGGDGLWYEGENYHLFALRGLLTGLGWTRLAGVEPFAEPELRPRLVAALRAPALTALPDFTFPARRDARYGMSLAQPMYLELWEVGLGHLRATESGSDDTQPAGGAGAAELTDWLAALYQSHAPPAAVLESYLHEAGLPAASSRDRTGLSWWSLLAMPPELGGDRAAWRPGSVLFEQQGLAILRRGGRYAGLECGAAGGGHGHPDRLHLTLHDAGVHWLPDPGAGSYVTRDLFWYRSTLAHNAPRVNGRSQAPGDAACEAFDVNGDWGWTRGRYRGAVRTLVAAPGYLLDVMELDDEEERVLELPWHLAGESAVSTPGAWRPAPDDPLGGGEFVSGVERFVPDAAEGPVTVIAERGGASLRLHLAGPAELLRATAPGLPDTGPATFLVARSRGRYVRMIAVLGPGELALGAMEGDVIEVLHDGVLHRHRAAAESWQVEVADETVRLAGRRAAPRRPEPLFDRSRGLGAQGAAPWIEDAPALDGTTAGFDLSAPLALDHDDQYRRSEQPYPGPDTFAAQAWVNWNDAGLFVAVEVTDPDFVIRPSDAPPLMLDNEPDQIHSSGIQVYLRSAEHGGFVGLLAVPDPDTGAVRVLPVAGTEAVEDMARGGWVRTDAGYRITLAVEPPDWSVRYAGDTIEFDLLVNEMRPGRQRRAGQLVWSGGGGWVWLRGDRQDPGRLGTVTLR